MLFSSITPPDEFVFAWRRGAPTNREPGTFPRSWVSCSCAPVTATAMRFAVVAQSLAATDGRSPSFSRPRSNAANKGRPGSSCGIYVTLCEAGDVAGHGGTVNQIHPVARGRGDCSGARRLERLGVRETNRGQVKPSLSILTPEILQALFPGADKVGEASGTSPRCLGLQGRSPAGLSVLNLGRDPIEGFLEPCSDPSGRC